MKHRWRAKYVEWQSLPDKTCRATDHDLSRLGKTWATTGPGDKCVCWCKCTLSELDGEQTAADSVAVFHHDSSSFLKNYISADSSAMRIFRTTFWRTVICWSSTRGSWICRRLHPCWLHYKQAFLFFLRGRLCATKSLTESGLSSADGLH